MTITGERLYRAAQAYQRQFKLYQKSDDPDIRLAWFIVVRELHYAAEDAWRSVQTQLEEQS